MKETRKKDKFGLRIPYTSSFTPQSHELNAQKI